MDTEEIRDRVAYLESLNDQLEAEVTYIDGLMRMLGFVNGLKTVKETAQDIYYSREDSESDDFED